METVLQKVNRLIIENCSTYNVNPALIKAIVQVESGWNFEHETSISYGIFGLIKKYKPITWENQVELAVRHIAHSIKKYDDINAAIVDYNAGSTIADRFISKGVDYIPVECKLYLTKVGDFYEIYGGTR